MGQIVSYNCKSKLHDYKREAEGQVNNKVMKRASYTGSAYRATGMHRIEYPYEQSYIDHHSHDKSDPGHQQKAYN
jgi:hypothetical protein